MAKSKSSKVLSVVFKICVVVGGFVAANLAGTAAICHINTKKMKLHEDQNNMMNTTSLGKRRIAVAADTQNAYVSCLSGYVDVDIERPINEKMNIEVFSVFGKVNLHLPQDINLTYDRPFLKKSSEDMESFEEESLPEVHIINKSILAKVVLHLQG